MRISDWSSDVCSSDLGFVGIVEDQGGEAVIRLFDFKVTHGIMSRFAKGGAQTRSIIAAVPSPLAAHSVIRPVLRSRRSSSSSTVPRIIAPVAPSGWPMAIARSEEHTSELQSLMRTSYAVF